MKKLSAAAALLACAALTGCQTPEQMQAARMQRLQGICASYGIKKGDPNYPECMMRADALLRAQQEASMAALAGTGTTLLQMGQPHYLGGAPTTTTCYQAGAATQCSTQP